MAGITESGASVLRDFVRDAESRLRMSIRNAGIDINIRSHGESFGPEMVALNEAIVSMTKDILTRHGYEV